MKDKQTYLTKGSFALLLFVILGYVVMFYPEQMIPFDSSIQTAIRGDLPAILTTIFRGITRLIDLPIVISWAILLTAIFYLKKWKSESLLVAGNLSLAGILIVSLKHLYQRPRPEILHLVEEEGFSFPSGHSLAVTLLIGSLIIIVGQRVKDRTIKLILQILLGIYLVSVIISRVYLGVHYPSDVLASLCLGLGILFIEFPFYDKLRFQWRFTGKQK